MKKHIANPQPLTCTPLADLSHVDRLLTLLDLANEQIPGSLDSSQIAQASKSLTRCILLSKTDQARPQEISETEPQHPFFLIKHVWRETSFLTHILTVLSSPTLEEEFKTLAGLLQSEDIMNLGFTNPRLFDVLIATRLAHHIGPLTFQSAADIFRFHSQYNAKQADRRLLLHMGSLRSAQAQDVAQFDAMFFGKRAPEAAPFMVAVKQKLPGHLGAVAKCVRQGSRARKTGVY